MFKELSEFLIIQNFKDFKTFNTILQYLAGDFEVGELYVTVGYTEQETLAQGAIYRQ